MDDAVLMLNGLPPRTQITLDAHHEAYVTNEQFSGIRSLPTGWHCVSWSITSSDKSTQEAAGSSNSEGIQPSQGHVRNVLLRWFGEGEIAVRELDRMEQRLVIPIRLPPSTQAGTSIGRSKRRHFIRALDLSSSPDVFTIVTPDVLSSVEPRLLPYPSAAQAPWRNATRNLSCEDGRVGRIVVAKVLGVEGVSGDSVMDSLAAGPSRSDETREQPTRHHNGNLGRNENGKVIWGKSRPGNDQERLQAFEVEVEDDMHYAVDSVDTPEVKKRKRSAQENGHEEIEDDESLLFTTFELRRSWPPNSVGAEITRWSEDKSWLLQDVARRSRLGTNCATSGDATEAKATFLPLLCEFELSFILFFMANNVYAWEQWKELCALFCRSSSIVGAQSTFQLHPSTIVSSSSPSSPFPRSNVPTEQIRLDAHTSFLEALSAQLNLLDSDFWSTQTSPAEEQTLLKELDVLRANIARSLSAAGAWSQQKDGLCRDQEKMVVAWRRLSHLTVEKFGWQLDRRLDEEAEVEDDVEAEEGEDAPVIVEM